METSFEDHVEVRRALDEHGADGSRNLLALGDELRGVVLRDDGLERLVDDAGKDAFVEVRAEAAVNLGSFDASGRVRTRRLMFTI